MEERKTFHNDKGEELYEEREEPFKDLGETLNYLLDLRLHKDEEIENEFWSFRGHRDKAYKLEVEPRKPDIPNDKIDYNDWFSQYQKRMFDKRELDYLNEKNLNEKNDWWWLYYARHHNLYTRLLDWTSNPLVAIYFAVENIQSRGNDKMEGVVWALKVNKEQFYSTEELCEKYKGLDPSNDLKDEKGRALGEKEWFMINPEPVTHRIVLQSSKFSYHPGINRPDKKPTPIEQMGRRTGEKLIKIKIDPGANAKIRKQLGIMNIHHASLFPSPTGIAYFINSEWPDIAKY